MCERRFETEEQNERGAVEAKMRSARGKKSSDK